MDRNLYRARILVVEDESFMRTLIVRALDGIGFTAIRAAENGEVALQLLERHPVDLIVSDIIMQPLDGFDLIRAVRTGKTPQARTTPAIFLTGLSDLPTVSSASQLDVQGFIVKPASATQLFESLRHALNVVVTVQPADAYERMSLSAAAAPTATGTPPDGSAAEARAATAFVDVLKLEAGMTLLQNVYAKGTLLVAANTELMSTHITAMQDLRDLLDERRIRVALPANEA